MKKLLREPFVHFLLLGALLFLADALIAKRDARAPGKIVVTQGQIENLAAVHERTWRRSPTPEEMKGLIDSHVREEVLYREGVALGLDRDDQLVRRRVRQKMDLLVEEAQSLGEPSESDLQAYLDTHRTRFAIEPRLSFRQVYLDPRREGRDLGREIPRLLAELKRAGDSDAASRAGDATQLEHQFEAAQTSDISRAFGTEFTSALATLSRGEWQGPIRSTYGIHFVLIRERIESQAPALAEVREAVRREWTRDRAVAWSEEFYRRLLERYSVTIEHPKVAQVR